MHESWSMSNSMASYNDNGWGAAWNDGGNTEENTNNDIGNDWGAAWNDGANAVENANNDGGNDWGADWAADEVPVSSFVLIHHPITCLISINYRHLMKTITTRLLMKITI